MGIHQYKRFAVLGRLKFDLMKHYNVFSYPDLFDDNLENLSDEELTTKLTALLYNIPSKPLIYHIAKINFELFRNPSLITVQFGLLDYWLKGIDIGVKASLKNKILKIVYEKSFDLLLFGKRYILDFYDFIFKNYINQKERKLTPDEILNTFKAYLIVVYQSNKRDEKTFENREGSNLTENLQKITWAFIINQYECNNSPDHVAELIKFYACVKEISTDSRLKDYLKEYMKINGFENIKQLIRHGYLLFALPEEIYNTADFYSRFPIIPAKQQASCLQNISINSEYYQSEPQKNIYYKFLKERPLFELRENEYAILDVAFLKGKIYTGFIFDFYYQTSLKNDSYYPKFDKFKSEFLSKKVIEEVVFKRTFEKIFVQRNNVVYFDNKEKISVPDCFCRTNDTIYFFECKDYLLNSNIYQTYSYEEIKKTIDLKFIKDESGIAQIKKQINNYINCTNEFPCDKNFSRTSRNLILYPIIVHTNFTLSLPGIQQYLNEQLKIELATISIPSNIIIKDLTLVNLDTFILHFYNFIEDSTLLAELIDKYLNDTQKYLKEFLNNPSPENYTSAYRSFDIEYSEKIKANAKDYPSDFMDIICEITGTDENLFNSTFY